MLDALTDMLMGLIDILPDGQAIPADLGGLSGPLSALDALVPIGSVIAAALGLLAAGVAFIALRVVLVIWNLIYP